MTTATANQGTVAQIFGPVVDVRFDPGPVIDTPLRSASQIRALQVPVHHYGVTVIDAHFVSAAHRHGVQVHAWTIDTAEQIQSLLALGVDGIMSDRPELLTRTFACASNG